MILAAAALFLTGDASALTFTVEPLVINAGNNGGSGVFGKINSVFDISGTVGLTSGITNFAISDVLILEMTLDPGSASVGGLHFGDSAPLFGDPIGAGAFKDFGDQAPSSLKHLPFDFLIGGVGKFTFLPNQLDAGETTVRLFVNYTRGSIVNLGDAVNFMISSGANFFVQPIIIPEPATGGLLLLGLGSLASSRWIRKSQFRKG